MSNEDPRARDERALASKPEHERVNAPEATNVHNDPFPVDPDVVAVVDEEAEATPVVEDDPAVAVDEVGFERLKELFGIPSGTIDVVSPLEGISVPGSDVTLDVVAPAAEDNELAIAPQPTAETLAATEEITPPSRGDTVTVIDEAPEV